MTYMTVLSQIILPSMAYIFPIQFYILMSKSPPTELDFLAMSSIPQIQETNEVESQVKVEQPVKVLTCIQRATNMIDNITESLYTEILSGLQSMHKRRKIQKDEDDKSLQKKKSILELKPVDIDLHKRMIRKFMRMNRKSIKSIEQRSIEFEQENRKMKQYEVNQRNQQKNKTLQIRRQQISERLKDKEALREQIQKFVVESNKRFGSVKSKKFLYQQKQQAFKRDVILPKIQQQKRILSKLKQRAKPINMEEILQHQKLYEEKRINDRLNRSLTSRVLQNDNFYEPPKFVSKAYLIAQAEEELKKQQEKMKEQQVEINQYRKKEFIKIMQEKHKQQMEKQKQASLQKSRSNKTFSIQSQKPKKQKQPKVQLNRQQTKNIGNQYMKQLIKLNRSFKAKPPVLQFSSQKTIETQQKRSKSQFQIELIREERIQKVQKIRLRKIEDIVNNKNLDNDFKLQRLKHQNQKFDHLLSNQHDSLNKKSDADELASIVLSSIHTKLAILQVTSPKS